MAEYGLLRSGAGGRARCRRRAAFGERRLQAARGGRGLQGGLVWVLREMPGMPRGRQGGRERRPLKHARGCSRLREALGEMSAPADQGREQICSFPNSLLAAWKECDGKGKTRSRQTHGHLCALGRHTAGQSCAVGGGAVTHWPHSTAVTGQDKEKGPGAWLARPMHRGCSSVRASTLPSSAVTELIN